MRKKIVSKYDRIRGFRSARLYFINGIIVIIIIFVTKLLHRGERKRKKRGEEREKWAASERKLLFSLRGPAAARKDQPPTNMKRLGIFISNREREMKEEHSRLYIIFNFLKCPSVEFGDSNADTNSSRSSILFILSSAPCFSIYIVGRIRMV